MNSSPLHYAKMGGFGWIKCGWEEGVEDRADVCKLAFLVSLPQYVLQTSFIGDV